MSIFNSGFSKDKFIHTSIGIAFGIGLFGFQKGVEFGSNKLTPYIRSLFRTNEEQTERVEQILDAQNKVADNEEWDELIDRPLPTLQAEPSTSTAIAIDSFDHLDDHLRSLFPTLELNEFKLQLVRLAANFAKYPVHMRLGRDRISTEEAKNLILNWMAWKIQNSALTNNALHFVTNWLENMKSMNGDQLLDQIEADLASVPNGDDTFEQWKIQGTMHGVHDFAVEHPEICVAATDLIDQIIIAVSGDDTISSERAAIVSDFQAAVEESIPVVAPLIGTGMLMQKSHPNEVRDLLAHMKNNQSLTFTTLSFVTSFFNLINTDQETTESVKTINRQIVQIIDEKPELFNQIVNVAKGVIEEHPELVPALEGAIQHAQTVIEEYPTLSKIGIQAAPHALEHPKQVRIAIQVAEMVLEGAGKLHEIVGSIDTDNEGTRTPKEYRGTPQSLEQAQTALSAASKIMKILEEAKEEKSGSIAEMSEPAQIETAVVPAAETASAAVAPQTSISFFWRASINIGNASIKSVIEEQDRMLHGMAHKIGAQGVNTIIDLSLQASAGEFDGLTTEQKAQNLGVGTLQFVGQVIKASLISSAQRVAYDTLKAGVVEFFPDAKDKIPSLEHATLGYQVTTAVVTEATKSDTSLQERAVNTLIHIETVALSMCVAPLTAQFAKDYISVPFLSPLIAGAAESLITRTILGIQGPIMRAIVQSN